MATYENVMEVAYVNRVSARMYSDDPELIILRVNDLYDGYMVTSIRVVFEPEMMPLIELTFRGIMIVIPATEIKHFHVATA